MNPDLIERRFVLWVNRKGASWVYPTISRFATRASAEQFARACFGPNVMWEVRQERVDDQP